MLKASSIVHEGALRGSHGHFSDDHVARLSTMVGAMGKELEKHYFKNVAASYKADKTSSTVKLVSQAENLASGGSLYCIIA